jgi:hypothetical protein
LHDLLSKCPNWYEHPPGALELIYQLLWDRRRSGTDVNCIVLGKVAISLTTIASDRDDFALVESGAQSILSEITL